MSYKDSVDKLCDDLSALDHQLQEYEQRTKSLIEEIEDTKKSNCDQQDAKEETSAGEGSSSGATGSGYFEGIDYDELVRETHELLEERKRILDENRVWLHQKFEESQRRRLMARVKKVENDLSFILLYISLSSQEDGSQTEEFQEFRAKLVKSAHDNTKLINKMNTLLDEVHARLEDMKNLKKMTVNLMEEDTRSQPKSTTFGILAEEIQQLDFVMCGVLPPRLDNSSGYMTVLQRCEEKFNSIALQINQTYGPAYDRWLYEVEKLILEQGKTEVKNLISKYKSYH